MLSELWRDGFFGKAILAVVAIALLLIPLGIYAEWQNVQAWDSYRVDHNCKVVGKTSPTVGVGVTTGPNQIGPVILTSPGKTGWQCDDGVTYWR